MSAFADAEGKLTKALSSVPDHARAQVLLGLVYMFTKRAAEGIAECEHALELDRNLASTHFFLGLAKIFIGRAEETEAHVAEALRLSPRDPLAYMWMHAAGGAKSHLGSWEELVAWRRRAVEANRNLPAAHFTLAAALAKLGRLDEARSAVKAGLALNPAFTISRARAAWTAWSDNPTYLAQLEPIFEGMRNAGLAEVMTAASASPRSSPPASALRERRDGTSENRANGSPPQKQSPDARRPARRRGPCDVKEGV